MQRTQRASTALTILAAIVLIPGGAQAQGGGQVNLTGTWRFSVNSEAGSGTPTVTLKQQGDSLSGSYSSQIFGEQQLKGSVKDREFNFAFAASLEGTSLTVTYRGTIASADSLHGTVSFGGAGNGTFTARRQAGGPAGPPPHSPTLAHSHMLAPPLRRAP